MLTLVLLLHSLMLVRLIDPFRFHYMSLYSFKFSLLYGAELIIDKNMLKKNYQKFIIIKASKLPPSTIMLLRIQYTGELF